MSVARRLGAVNSLFGVLALLFPPLAYIPGGALAAVMTVVGAIWATNHFWVGPAALSSKTQQALAAARVNQVRAERVANAVYKGKLSAPPEAWLLGALSDPDERRRWSERLAEVEVHDPANRLSDGARSRLMEFLVGHLNDREARRFAFLVFRVGGADPRLYGWAQIVTDPAEATYLFDSFETRQLLADRSYWGQHAVRKVRPWAPAIYSYVGGRANGDTAFGVFQIENDGRYGVRAGGERPAEGWRGCKVEAEPSGVYIQWNDAGHPDFGAQFFRMNQVRDDFGGKPTLPFFKRERASGVYLKCPDKRVPAEGQIPL